MVDAPSWSRSTRPRRLADALGLADGLASVPQRIDLDTDEAWTPGGELWAMMLDTAATFDGLVRRHADSEEQVERILTNPFYRNIAGALSGTQEYMAAETLHELHGDDRFDLVIVDTPPSRNALDFLEAPGVLARFLDHRLFRLLMLPTRGGLRVIGTATQPILQGDRQGGRLATCWPTRSRSSRRSPGWRPASASGPTTWCG